MSGGVEALFTSVAAGAKTLLSAGQKPRRDRAANTGYPPRRPTIAYWGHRSPPWITLHL